MSSASWLVLVDRSFCLGFVIVLLAVLVYIVLVVMRDF